MIAVAIARAIAKKSTNKAAMSSAVSSSSTAPVESSIRHALQHTFVPSYLEVLNESSKHNVPKNSETHFKVVVVSEKFNDSNAKTLLQRHRLVNAALADQLSGPVHALSIVAKTPDQWLKSEDKSLKPSPTCRGGDGSF